MPAGNKYNQFATLWSSRMLTSSTNLIYLWIVDLWRICQVDPSQPILEKEIRKYVFNTYIQYNPKCINFFCTKIERQSLVDFSKEFLLHQRYFLSLSHMVVLAITIFHQLQSAQRSQKNNFSARIDTNNTICYDVRLCQQNYYLFSTPSAKENMYVETKQTNFYVL